MEELNYYRDPRVSAKRDGRWFDDFDSRGMRCLVTVWKDDEEVCGWIPVHFEVCSLCQGRGKHTNPSIDAGGLSYEDFDRDPDFERDYRRGVHDVPCYECSGNRVVPAPNHDDFLSPEEVELVQLLREKQEDEAAHAAEVAAEMRWGC